MNLNHIPESLIECPMCQSRSWTIFQHRVQCCRCGLSYAVLNIGFLQTSLIPQTIPTPEVLMALRVFEGKE